MLAVLSRHAGVSTANADVFVNVVGGVRVDEPGADLAIALAVASAAAGTALQSSGSTPLCAFGEIGLTGELRSVAHHLRREQEANKFGLGDPLSPQRAGTLREAIKLANTASQPDSARSAA